MPQTSILVVEDDQELLESYRLHLEDAGFRVIGIGMAETLLQVYQLEHPDILLMDIHLPGIDGLKIMQKLRQLPKAEECRAIFISAHDDEHYISEAFALGADDYILKPINWTILTRRLCRMAEDIKRQRRLRILANTFRNASEGMIVTDLQGRMIEVNDSLSQITGYTSNEVLGKTPAIFSSGKHDNNFYETMWRQLIMQGRWSGEIWNRRKNGEVYPQWLSINAVYDGAGQVSNYIGIFSDISHLKEQEAQLLKQANHDPLTGLPNRLLLVDRLQQAINRTYRDNCGLGVLFIDLDGFKGINDENGHDAGDRVLRELARRYMEILRREDTVARMGGDEFVVLLGQLHQAAEAEAIASKLLEITHQPIDLGGYSVQLGCSIGIATSFDVVENPETLIRHADGAMYDAKRSGKNRYALYPIT